MVFSGDLKVPPLEVSMQAMDFFSRANFCGWIKSLVLFSFILKFVSASEIQVEQFATGILLQLWLFSNLIYYGICVLMHYLTAAAFFPRNIFVAK